VLLSADADRRARRARLGLVTSARQLDPAPDREIRLGRVRQVIDHLVRDATAVARLDGSIHTLFPVAIGAAEGAAIRSWVVREQAARTIEIGLGYGISALRVEDLGERADIELPLVAASGGADPQPVGHHVHPHRCQCRNIPAAAGQAPAGFLPSTLMRP
jgi:hypothetical protein